MTRALPVLLALFVLIAGCSNAPPSTPAPTTAPATPPAPVSLSIPSLGVTSSLTRTGLNADGSPEVPPVTEPQQASWATWSPEPGEVGPAVIYGHINGERNGEHGVPGVFAELASLATDAEIVVSRADGSRAVFTVTTVRVWPKSALDVRAAGDRVAREVYGDTTDAQIRLVSCGGQFDRGARSYDSQVVGFGRLVRIER